MRPVSSQATFSERLRDIMDDKRMTTPALSDMSNVSERTITRYRAGTSEPRDSFGDPTPNAYALAEALAVTVDELLDARPEALAS